MRRREYLHAIAGASGLAVTGTTALTVAGDDALPSTDESTTTTSSPVTAAATPAGASTATTSSATDEPASTATGTGTADGSEIAPLARIDVSSDLSRYQATEAVTTPDGRYAFVSKLDGFHVVDCADPETPEIVASRDGIATADGLPLEPFLDLKYNQGRLLLATGGRPQVTGIALFDVRDPTDPRQYRTYRTTYSIHNCDLHGEYAYLTTGQALDVVHVATAEPESVATWSVTDYDDAYEQVQSPLRNLHDIYVQGGRAYLAYWDVGSWILDVSDPTAPEHVGHVAAFTPSELADLEQSAVFEYVYEPPGNSHYVQPNDGGDVMAVGKESWDVERNAFESGESEESDTGGPSGITLWDVEDPADPSELATIDPPPVPEGENASRNDGYWTTAHNFDIVGDYLYSSWYRGGVKVHDISDPANPEELAHWANGDAASFWTARVGVPGEFFVGTSYANPTDDTAPGGFYTFPDPTSNDATVTPAGSDVDVPTAGATTAGPTTAGTRSTTSRAEPRTSSSSTTTGTGASMPTPGSTATANSTPTATDGEETTTGNGPGFGPLTALGALGVGAWRFVRDGDE